MTTPDLSGLRTYRVRAEGRGRKGNQGDIGNDIPGKDYPHVSPTPLQCSVASDW
jgi:hypothetical protein